MVVLDTTPHSDTVILILGVAKVANLVVIPCRPPILDLEALAGTLELVSITPVPVLAVLIAFLYETYPFHLVREGTPWSFSVVEDNRDIWGNQHPYFENAGISVVRVTELD